MNPIHQIMRRDFDTIATALAVIHRDMNTSIDDGLAIEEAAFARIAPTCDAREGIDAFL